MGGLASKRSYHPLEPAPSLRPAILAPIINYSLLIILQNRGFRRAKPAK